MERRTVRDPQSSSSTFPASSVDLTVPVFSLPLSVTRLLVLIPPPEFSLTSQSSKSSILIIISRGTVQRLELHGEYIVPAVIASTTSVVSVEQGGRTEEPSVVEDEGEGGRVGCGRGGDIVIGGLEFGFWKVTGRARTEKCMGSSKASKNPAHVF